MHSAMQSAGTQPAPAREGRGHATPPRLESSDAAELFEFGCQLYKDVVWREKVALLKDFVGEHGRMPVWNEEYRGAKIGMWCHTQRQAKKGLTNGKMTPERTTALEAVPGWRWGHEDRWRTNCELLEDFVQEHGRLPGRREKYQGVRLGIWADTQCSARRGQNSCRMTPERAAALEAIPGWRWSGDDVWKQKLALLEDFARAHGRLPHQIERHGGVNIGSWLSTQRAAKINQGLGVGRRMTPERIAALEAVPGWCW